MSLASRPNSLASNGPAETAETEVAAPALFQLFGQRFLLDSYVLSHVVYDSISFQGRKVKRQMPLGLDAMAALGNDEATRLLRPELEESSTRRICSRPAARSTASIPKSSKPMRTACGSTRSGSSTTCRRRVTFPK